MTVLVSTVLQHRTVVHACLSNAAITVAPYDNDEFRVQQIEKAICVLQSLRVRLETQIAINNMKQGA